MEGTAIVAESRSVVLGAWVGEGIDSRGHERTFWGGRYVLHPDQGGGPTTVCVY